MYETEKVFRVDHKEATLISLKNRKGMELRLLSYGAAVVDILTPDREGRVESVVLSYENIGDYVKNSPYFGVTVGRTAGRIAEGTFCLDGKVYNLNKNYGPNHGHGGPGGFSFQVWDYEIQEVGSQNKVIFTYLSKDMEENYPGNLHAKVTYTLTEENEVVIEYEAETDRKTLCNLTNHAYFNLSGNYKRKVTEQYLRMDTDGFLRLNSCQIPEGEITPVMGTPMDFRSLKLIGKDIGTDDEQLIMAKGYDHPWMLCRRENQIEMLDEKSGRKMMIATTYPCVVVYTYNYPNNEKLKYGKVGSRHDGICFETQYEPDGIHHEHLHPAILDVGEKYYERTIFKFSIA
ncbi:aldose 1-epimerase [Anaerosolibacter carboniphilus]|uniref:Aldose 1-epimerase n=1 Tax=Anaerosolibacter carboniphilus TaxID=1417629 RepID=A0A841KPK3_9FIRM|nr:aldose epimerase family protein [Anaerosolibacter carboniphilus]MBB6215251.1 aldose 1-epimerase [Anaerosolibacter carboniphilus]